MHSDKKITKEDTWRPADLRRHIREEGHGDDHVRRRDDNERKHRGGESIERRRKDPEKEPRRDRDKHREREGTRERRDEEGKDRYAERSKEDSRDRRGDKERGQRDERDKDTEKRKERDRLVDGNRYNDDYRENRDRMRNRDEHVRERDKERRRDKEKDKAKDRERYNDDRDKRREERDKERRREEQHREHRTERERKRHEESGEGGRAQIEKHDREQRDRHRERERHNDDYEEKRNDRERRERHGDRRHSERKEERDYREEHRRHKEERERRHKERAYHDEKQKHESESREYRDLKRSGEEERYHRGDRERAEWNKEKERRHRGEEDPEKKHKERKHREEEDPEEKHNERRRREEEDLEKKHKERKRREEEDLEKKHKERRRREEEDPEEKHKERRRREEKDLVRNSSDRTSPKKSASSKSHRHETNTLETEVVNDEDLADQEYEDDFEDYEEDFEEMDQSEDEDEDEKEPEFTQAVEDREEHLSQKRKEIEAIQRAMNEENERVGTTQSKQSMSRGEEDASKWVRGSERNQSRASPRGRFIDFVAAKRREVSKKVATKQKKRSTELLRLIDLDFSLTFSLLDLPPVNEYDMYIRTFGTVNTKQAYVQCNEDNADRDIQTEEIEVREKWTQHPPERNGACGDPNLSQEAREKNMNEMKFDSQRLTAFLRSASQVMVVLLEEVQAERNSLRKLRTQTDTLSFSDGSLQLNTKLPFLYGRRISMVHFSQVQRHTMMSVHTPTNKPSAVRLDSCTIICIWNIWEPSRPQKILVYESEVQCCCFSPGKAILVFAGTSVGSVALWDLREHAGNHYRLQIGEEEWTFRQPTFSTDAVLAGSGHFSSVTSVEVVPSTVAGGLRPEVPLLASEEESSGLSFQLASLDESGVLNFWVVVELPKANEAGSPTDLGLRPGGKIKLLHSSSLLTAERVSPRGAVKTGPLQTLHLKFLPTDSNHFFIGTNMGLVSHGTSHGLKAPPKFYRFQEVGVRPVDVSSIHFSPFRQNFFLVGCVDGSIRLHAVSQEQPVAEWKNSTAGEPVVSLQWTQTRPTVFCVLDAASNLHIWDLMKNDTEPVVTERMSEDRVTAMAVFGDSGQQNTYSGIALVHESGKIEMHYLTRNLSVPVPAEEERLESMMTEAF